MAITTFHEDSAENWTGMEVDYDPVTTKEQLAELDRKLSELQNALPARTPEKWLRRNWYWLSVGAALILGSGIGISALTVFKNAVIDNRVREALREPVQKLSSQGERLANMEGAVSGMKESLNALLQNELRRTAALPQKDFQKQLPTIASLIDAAKSNATPLPAETTIQQKILASENSPDYWPAVAAFVNYRSPSGDWESLPVCIEQPARVRPSAGIVFIENCQIQLDGPEAPLFYAMMARYSFIGVVNHCLVAYRGGPIPLEAMKKLTFVNCRFDVDIKNKQPPKFAAEVLRSLMAANNQSHVEMPLSTF